MFIDKTLMTADRNNDKACIILINFRVSTIEGLSRFGGGGSTYPNCASHNFWKFTDIS